MRATVLAALLGLAAFFAAFTSFRAQAPAPGNQDQLPAYIQQGQQLMREGKMDQALALYRSTLQSSPRSVPANIAAGIVLDLTGQGPDARKYFAKAIDVADTPERKAVAQRAMAMSYAFEGDCAKTVEYERQVFDYSASQKNFYQQGEIADEMARVCLDSGDYDAAYHWYQSGREAGLREPNLSPARRDLWDFRWESAQARIAARRGQQDDAQKHLAAADSVLEKATNPEQAPFLPSLRGYVAFYAKNYQAALDSFQRANQDDPFIQCMLAQTYEALGQKDKAIEFYRRAAASINHNPAAAYAVPLSKKKLAALSS